METFGCPFLYWCRVVRNEGYHADGIAHKQVDGTLHLKITLSLKSTDEDIHEIADGIKEHIVTILEAERFQADVAGLPYRIEVYGKDHQLIAE
jgi:hypothetical protein